MNFKIDKFEGPLGLLLKLIEKQELDIMEISLAKIADQYIEYIRSYKGIGPEELADFLVVAAKLLLIKSMALLPFLKGEVEEEIQEFEHQLRMYKEFLEAAKKIEAIIGKKRFSFAREFNRRAFLANSNIFSPPKNLTAADLLNVFSEIIKNIRPVEKLEEKNLEQIINIEDKILAIQQILLEKIKVSFNYILAGAKNKTEVIVSFLALLELIKQRNIMAAQGEMFGEIEINRI
ncbi:segregation/condensation protein A [Patescibacteria group bacterium]|nr:segregation/condensation protein A [Patescibacteria group bacterium]MBU1663125.1 segregation/condensation protein A [Patescibacteria group bacterium]MBU1933712.1 segregation/condensation protein A [Patescibacteria group bacterium]MBU2008024.1 segregation/condensation protein A [Patescibacteria group bacterium]MBU2233709.1 segregation/condensation protein A [Patescibacteria group bacterium]